MVAFTALLRLKTSAMNPGSGRHACCVLPYERWGNPITEDEMNRQIKQISERQSGRVLVPAILWMAGVPFTLVLILWLLFFRG